MDSSAMALIGTLVLVILTLPLGPSWFMVFPVLIGMIAFSWHRRRRSDQGLPLHTPPPPGGAPPPPGGGPPPPGPPSPGGAPPGASPPADPPPASSAPPPAVDALVPSGKKRSEPESSSTPSSPSGFEHELFLNCGELEIDSPFMVDLKRALENARIRVFRGDDVEREPHGGGEFWSWGGVFMSQVERMDRWLKRREPIKRSRISIAIFSEYFATSKQCLDQLVQMWEGRESNGQIIIPIFYDVSPSDVIHQAGGFGRAFNLHEIAKVDSNTIEKWRRALRQIGRLRGFTRENLNGHESALVNIVVKRVVQVLRKDDQFVTDRLVGIDHHVQEMMRKLGVGHSEGQAVKAREKLGAGHSEGQVVEVRGEEVRVVVIWGAPGVGKTTLAKVVFNKMHKLFDACSFLEDIRSEGVQFSRHRLIADLQKQKLKPLESSGDEIENLCYNARVLIVLDGMDKDVDIRELLGDFNLFGQGSRIIVTTDQTDVLEVFRRAACLHLTLLEEHEVGPMSDKNALELFHKHAFQGAAAEDVSKYDSLSGDIVKAIGGLPTDIEVHASYLGNNMNMGTWKTTLDLLREKPKK